MRRGVDVASFQGHLDFDVLATKVAFIFAKCTEGTGFFDPTFNRNWTEAKRVGMRRGAYHFARPDLGLSASAEAAYFLSHLGPLGQDDELALDYEVVFNDPVGWCLRWLNDVQAMTGKKPFIYLNRSHMALDWSPVIAGGYPLWLAAYDGLPDLMPQTPWPSVTIKQWTSDGVIPGIPSLRVDLNTWFGEEMNIPQFAAQSVTNINIVVGEVAQYDGIWIYNGVERHVIGKVIGYTPGVRLVTLYPPADPDADQTLVLDAQPAYFVVATRANP